MSDLTLDSRYAGYSERQYMGDDHRFARGYLLGTCLGATG